MIHIFFLTQQFGGGWVPSFILFIYFFVRRNNTKQKQQLQDYISNRTQLCSLHLKSNPTQTTQEACGIKTTRFHIPHARPIGMWLSLCGKLCERLKSLQRQKFVAGELLMIFYQIKLIWLRRRSTLIFCVCFVGSMWNHQYTLCGNAFFLRRFGLNLPRKDHDLVQFRRNNILKNPIP